MIKSIIKETIIMLLLCIAILLIIGILFYDYIPTNKIVPTKQAYETPNNVKEEINETITELEKTEISYEITDADLNVYKQKSSYKPGKANPFALEEEQPENVDTNSNSAPNTNSNVNKNNVSSGNNSGNGSSTQTFFNDTK